MLNLIQADLYKLWKSLAIKVLLGMTAASAIVMASMAYLIPQGKIDARMTGIGFMFSDMNIISILGAVVAGILICGDFDNKTIHNAISGGTGRGAIIVSKAVVFGVALMVLLLPYAIVTALALVTGEGFDMGSVSIGFLHVLTEESGTVFAGADILKLAAIMLTLVFVYAAQLSICMPLAFLLKKPVFVVALYYGFSILSAQLMGLSDSSQAFNRIFSATPYGGRHTFMTLETAAGDMARSIVIGAVFIAIMVGITYFAFRKSEIK